MHRHGVNGLRIVAYAGAIPTFVVNAHVRQHECIVDLVRQVCPKPISGGVKLPLVIQHSVETRGHDTQCIERATYSAAPPPAPVLTTLTPKHPALLLPRPP